MKANVFLALVIFGLLSCTPGIKAQNYWVYFADKVEGDFDPYSFFDPHTLQRRLRHDIPLVTFSDLPVNPEYVREVSALADSTGYVSRWFNAVAVVAGENSLDAIRQLPFVDRVELSTAVNPRCPAGFLQSSDSLLIGDNDYSLLMDDECTSLKALQVNLLDIREFQKNGLNGKGIRVAVFDGGFPGYLTHEAFEHIREKNNILLTWDFTKNKENVNRGIAHGTMVLSCIAGIVGNQPMGLATEASFMLAITEIRREPFKEEQNWLAAAEWAEKHGADIINSSLGYTTHRYFNSQMDGKSAFVSRAANMAASKGILVVNAAGNEGSDKWKIIGAPADADSVLSVGGIDPWTGTHTSFSSYGPTADKRLKPNVVASGHVEAAGKTGISNTQGTSFASPLIAGFAACAWQSDSSLTNMELFRKIEQSGHLYPYFDYAHGYGIPQASFFTGSLQPVSTSAFTLDVGATGHFKITCLPIDDDEEDYFGYEEVEEAVEEEPYWDEADSDVVWEEAPDEEILLESDIADTIEAVEWELLLEEDVPVPEEWEWVEEEVIDGSMRWPGNADKMVNGLPASHPKNRDFLYIHVKNKEGVIERYMVLRLDDTDRVINTIEDARFTHLQLQFGETLCVHFHGKTECFHYRRR